MLWSEIKITTNHGFLRRFPFIDHERFQTLLRVELDNPFLSRNVSAEPWDTFSNTDEKKEFSGKFNRTKLDRIQRKHHSIETRTIFRERILHFGNSYCSKNEQHVFPREFDPRYQSVIYELEHACRPSLSIKLITSITSRRQLVHTREMNVKFAQNYIEQTMIGRSFLRV